MPFTANTKDSLMNQLSRNSRLPTTDPIAISKIYPTPPSVETTDKRYEEAEMMVEGHSVDLWDRQVRSHCQRWSCTVLAYENPILHVNLFPHVHVSGLPTLRTGDTQFYCVINVRACGPVTSIFKQKKITQCFTQKLGDSREIGGVGNPDVLHIDFL